MKLKLYVSWYMDKYSQGPSLHVSQYQTAGGKYFEEYFPIGEIDVDIPFEIPGQADQVKAKVAVLRKEQGELQAAINTIEGQIQDLMCLEHKPEDV